MQLMQAYVQKSTSTTRPRNCARLSGSELSQRSMPVNSGAAPRSGNAAAGLAGPAAYAKPGAASAAAIDARKARRSEKRDEEGCNVMVKAPCNRWGVAPYRPPQPEG